MGGAQQHRRERRGVEGHLPRGRIRVEDRRAEGGEEVDHLEELVDLPAAIVVVVVRRVDVGAVMAPRLEDGRRRVLLVLLLPSDVIVDPGPFRRRRGRLHFVL